MSLRSLFLASLALVATTAAQAAAPPTPETTPNSHPAAQVAEAPAPKTAQPPSSTPEAPPLVLETASFAGACQDRGEDRVALRRPTPPPNYCPECISCTSDLQCGRDANGSLLGTCASAGNSYCGYKPYRTCICY